MIVPLNGWQMFHIALSYLIFEHVLQPLNFLPVWRFFFARPGEKEPPDVKATAISKKRLECVRPSIVISNMVSGSANPCSDCRRYHSRQMCQSNNSSQEDIPMIRSFFA